MADSLQPNARLVVLQSDRGGSGGAWSADVLEEARKTILDVMRGAGGRNAQARLRASEVVLGRDFLAHLPDEVLLAEVKRRTKNAG